MKIDRGGGGSSAVGASFQCYPPLLDIRGQICRSGSAACVQPTLSTVTALLNIHESKLQDSHLTLCMVYCLWAEQISGNAYSHWTARSQMIAVCLSQNFWLLYVTFRFMDFDIQLNLLLWSMIFRALTRWEYTCTLYMEFGSCTGQSPIFSCCEHSLVA